MYKTGFEILTKLFFSFTYSFGIFKLVPLKCIFAEIFSSLKLGSPSKEMNLPSFKKYKNFPKIDKTLPDKEIKRYLLYLFDLAKFPNAENL